MFVYTTRPWALEFSLRLGCIFGQRLGVVFWLVGPTKVCSNLHAPAESAKFKDKAVAASVISARHRQWLKRRCSETSKK